MGIGLDFASIIAAAFDIGSRYDRPYYPTPGYNPGYDYSDVVDGTRPILLMRAGVEIYHHLRIESSIYIGGRYANGFSLSVGFVIGGRPKKY